MPGAAAPAPGGIRDARIVLGRLRAAFTPKDRGLAAFLFVLYISTRGAISYNLNKTAPPHVTLDPPAPACEEAPRETSARMESHTMVSDALSPGGANYQAPSAGGGASSPAPSDGDTSCRECVERRWASPRVGGCEARCGAGRRRWGGGEAPEGRGVGEPAPWVMRRVDSKAAAEPMRCGGEAAAGRWRGGGEAVARRRRGGGEVAARWR